MILNFICRMLSLMLIFSLVLSNLKFSGREAVALSFILSLFASLLLDILEQLIKHDNK